MISLLRKTSVRQILLWLIVIAAAAGSYTVYALYQARSANAITFWLKSNEENNSKINHQTWQRILDTYLMKSLIKSELESDSLVTNFDYAGVTANDKSQLVGYLNQLQVIDPRNFSKVEQFAYWVNLYNALTVNLILDNYPVSSIREIGYPALGQLNTLIGPWDVELALIADQKLTLNQIEHGILRAIWRDARVHYVINCASLGCPDLLPKALTSSNMEQQMQFAARNFINQGKAVKFIGGKVTLSSIYNWFSNDFGTNQEELIRHLAFYAKPKLANQLKQYLLEQDQGEIDYQYDWQLNNSNTKRIN